MSVFKTESELMGTAVVRPVSKRAKQWAEQAEFIDQLAMNEGKYACWSKTYTTFNNAMVAAKTMQQRTMHAFKVCDWPGRFKTIIASSFHVRFRLLDHGRPAHADTGRDQLQGTQGTVKEM